MIDETRVGEAFKSCLFQEDEIEIINGEQAVPDNAVLVDGIRSQYGFHRERLEAVKEEVRTWIKELPIQFRHDQGGGWSFLNACVLENGDQWTGFHVKMEELFCLAIGLDLAAFLMPREIWPALPGGMPYYVLFIEGKPKEENNDKRKV